MTDELKFIDFNTEDAMIAAGGTIMVNADAEASFVRIAQGDGESNRDGRKCCIKKICWRYRVQLADAGTAGTATETVRVIMYLDKQTNGAAATVTDILEADDFQSFNNLANKSRFRILYDQTLTINLTGAEAATALTKRVNKQFYKNCSIPIEFNNAATTGALATVRSNNIGILLISESGRASLTGVLRLRFQG